MKNIIKYDVNNINELLKILNTITTQGVDNAIKISNIFQILNNPINEPEETKDENNIKNNTISNIG